MIRAWHWLQRALRGRREDERGATFVLTAICMVVLLWGGAVGVDLGMTVADSRQTQAVADTTALDTVRYIDMINALSQASAQTTFPTYLAHGATDNHSTAAISGVPGVWQNGSFTPTGSGGIKCYFHFPNLPPYCNAVQVTATEGVPQIFFGGHGSVSRSAVAAVTPEATFSIGTYLVNLSSSSIQVPVLNGILGTLGSVNLTAADYDGMANSYVTIRQLIQASSGVLTPSNVMTASPNAQTWQGIWEKALTNITGTCTTQTPNCEAETALATPTALNPTTSAQLCQLVNLSTSSSTTGTNALGCSAYSSSTTALSTAALSTQLNVLQLFETEAELANGTNAVNLGSTLGLPNVVSASLETQLVSPPVVAIGPVDTEAQTAQVALTLNLQISLPVQGNFDVSIALSGANGTATLETLLCTNNSLNDATIQPEVTAVSTSASSVDEVLLGPPGNRQNVGSMTMSGYSGSAFGYTSGVVPPTASTASGDTNPITAGTTSPGVALTVNGSVNSTLSTLLSGPVAGALGDIFQAAGVTVGGATVADLATNCGAVSLVQ